MGLVQIDFVNVLAPSHYLVLFSRVGPYPLARFDDLVYRRREFIEHWAHEASIVPVELWPLLAYRRETHRVRPYGFEAFLERNPRYVADAKDLVRIRGPIVSADLPDPEGASRRIEKSWVSVPRAVLEALFGRGTLAIADRRPGFVRVYDLTERILPPEILGTSVDRADAVRDLLRMAARALAVATADDLADYFRMSATIVKPRLAELVADGSLQQVHVEGWTSAAYTSAGAVSAARIDASALLSPFDPLVWHRARARRVFDFDHRFEIFVPAEKRRWGCYVLPFLQGDRLVARVDLRSDRETRTLRVLAAHLEKHADAHALAPGLAAELEALSVWLEFDRIDVSARGQLARALLAVLRSKSPSPHRANPSRPRTV